MRILTLFIMIIFTFCSSLFAAHEEQISGNELADFSEIQPSYDNLAAKIFENIKTQLTDKTTEALVLTEIGFLGGKSIIELYRYSNTKGTDSHLVTVTEDIDMELIRAFDAKTFPVFGTPRYRYQLDGTLKGLVLEARAKLIPAKNIFELRFVLFKKQDNWWNRFKKLC